MKVLILTSIIYYQNVSLVLSKLYKSKKVLKTTRFEILSFYNLSTEFKTYCVKLDKLFVYIMCHLYVIGDIFYKK